jgi:hypothetical protein
MPPSDGLIVVTQRNPSSLTAVHGVTNPVVVPPVSASPAKSFRFMEKPLPVKIGPGRARDRSVALARIRTRPMKASGSSNHGVATHE